MMRTSLTSPPTPEDEMRPATVIHNPLFASESNIFGAPSPIPENDILPPSFAPPIQRGVRRASSLRHMNPKELAIATTSLHADSVVSLTDSEMTRSQRPSSVNSRGKSPSLLDLARRPSRTDIHKEEIERVIFQKAHPRRRTLEPLDNCVIYIDSGPVDEVSHVDAEGRITGYTALPSLSPKTTHKFNSPPMSRKSEITEELRHQFESRDYQDPFAKPVLQPIGEDRGGSSLTRIKTPSLSVSIPRDDKPNLAVLRSRSKTDVFHSPLNKQQFADTTNKPNKPTRHQHSNSIGSIESDTNTTKSTSSPISLSTSPRDGIIAKASSSDNSYDSVSSPKDLVIAKSSSSEPVNNRQSSPLCRTTLKSASAVDVFRASLTVPK